MSSCLYAASFVFAIDGNFFTCSELVIMFRLVPVIDKAHCATCERRCCQKNKTVSGAWNEGTSILIRSEICTFHIAVWIVIYWECHNYEIKIVYLKYMQSSEYFECFQIKSWNLLVVGKWSVCIRIIGGYDWLNMWLGCGRHLMHTEFWMGKLLKSNRANCWGRKTLVSHNFIQCYVVIDVKTTFKLIFCIM